MHLQDEVPLQRRQWGGVGNEPWWCYFWPPACQTSTRPGGGISSTSTQQTSTSTKPPPTTTPRPTAPRTTTPPAATQPATPPAAPPAATQTAKPQPQPQPAPSPSPTTQSPASPPMSRPPAPNTRSPDAQSAAVDPVIVQPSESGANPTPTQGGDSKAGDQSGKGGSSPTEGSGDNGTPGSGLQNQPGHSGVPPAFNPSASAGPVSGGIGGASAVDGTGGSGGGLPPGAIAGIVVGLLLLFALLALLLYRFRRSPIIARLPALFGKLGGGSGGFQRVDTPSGDGMGRTLLGAGARAPAVTGGAPIATASSSPNEHGPRSQPPMSQPGRLHPLLVPAAVARRDNNRVSVFTNASDGVAGAFTPSPVSPLSPASMLSPGTVRTSRPVQGPPDHRTVSAANAHVSRGSLSSISTGSAISAALSPGQMAWPMPPGTPPVIQTPDGPQYINFQQFGETVVRINQPSRGSRRPGGH